MGGIIYPTQDLLLQRVRSLLHLVLWHTDQSCREKQFKIPNGAEVQLGLRVVSTVWLFVEIP